MVPPKLNNFPLTGGCNCGAIRFEVTEPLVMASYRLWGKERSPPAGRPTRQTSSSLPQRTRTPDPRTAPANRPFLGALRRGHHRHLGPLASRRRMVGEGHAPVVQAGQCGPSIQAQARQDTMSAIRPGTARWRSGRRPTESGRSPQTGTEPPRSAAREQHGDRDRASVRGKVVPAWA
jgi:hypothetical protein